VIAGAGAAAGFGLAARVERILCGPVLAAPTVAARLLLAGVLAATVGAPIAVGASSTLGSDQSDKPTVHRPGEKGLTLPRIRQEVKPEYTPEAMKARIQGRVVLEAIVLASGAVDDVSILTSLDTEHGLDERAVAAMKQWRFEPGAKDGKPVAVRIEVEMVFRLREAPPA
jgi:protein TonB